MTFHYQKLAEALRQQIDAGVYRRGERLPGVREFASQRDVSISTALAAYHQLEDEGMLESRHRSGFYVCAARTALPQPRLADIQPRMVGSQQAALLMNRAANVPGVIRLGAAVPAPEFLPVKQLEKAVATALSGHRQRILTYEYTRGAPELQLQIARRMASAGSVVAPDDVVVTNGCQEALTLALRCVTRPGDTVAIESPAYYGLLQVLDVLRLKALEIPTDSQLGMSPQALQLALENWPVKVCVLNASVNNPQGFVVSEHHKRQLMQLLHQHQVPLIEDDTYADLAFAPVRPPSCMALMPDADVIHCSTFSKTLSPDMRVGWVVAPQRTSQLEYQKFVSNISSSSLPQLAVAQLLQNGGYDRFLRKARQDYRIAVERMQQRVMCCFPAGTTVSQPQGGFLLWVTLPANVDSEQLAEQALRYHISIAPGTLFSSAGKYRHCIRLCCANAWTDRLEAALKKLGQLCVALQ